MAAVCAVYNCDGIYWYPYLNDHFTMTVSGVLSCLLLCVFNTGQQADCSIQPNPLVMLQSPMLYGKATLSDGKIIDMGVIGNAGI